MIIEQVGLSLLNTREHLQMTYRHCQFLLNFVQFFITAINRFSRFRLISSLVLLRYLLSTQRVL